MKLIATILLAAAVSPAFAQYNKANLSVEDNSEAITKLTKDKLRIYPIRANDVFRAAHRNIGSYTLLDEALEDNRISITEHEDGATVQTLMAKNNSKDTIYLMAGEVVKGGQQDRVIAQDVILAPDEEIDLGAFCVESGRWSGGSVFGEYFGVSGQSVRKAAAADKDQSAVWSNVDELTGANEAASPTSTLAELENAEDYQAELKAYQEHFKSVFIGDTTVVGFVAATGDSVLGCDLFATNALFLSTYDNILQAYIAEAMTSGSDVTISTAEVHSYMDDFLMDESKQEEQVGKNGFIFKHAGKKLHLTKF